MMTTYLVPCGLSVLRKLRERNAPYPATDARAAFLAAEKQWRAESLPAAQLIADWARRVGVDAEDARVGEADRGTFCAETQTLALRAPAPLPRLLGQGHRVVLLASDTNDGIGAAMCTAYIMTGGDLSKIRYLTAPGKDQARGFPELLAESTVTIVRIPGLGPHTGGVRTAVAAIGRVLYAAHLLGGDLEVHLTGGFKLTLLHTMAMTEIVYSMAPELTTAWYVYEDGADAVAIGLRLFSKDLLEDMREELTNAAHGRAPGGPATFKGQLWQQLGEGSQLTDFGEGFLAVLGGPTVS
jgi:hypothetical protein